MMQLHVLEEVVTKRNVETDTLDIHFGGTIQGPITEIANSITNESQLMTSTTLAQKTNPHNSSSESCFRLNSKAWLEGPRIGNIRELPDTMASDLILDLAPRLLIGGLDQLLGYTICHAQGRFRDYKTRHDDRDLQFWALRFFYLGFHLNQHQGAIEEAKLRRNNHCDLVLKQKNIGNFDFECPNTKFIVVQLTKDAGLGAHMRLGALNALVAGVATNRTTLLLNHGDKKPWSHASCDRGDLQCFYMPPSPCVITEQDLSEAYKMTNGESRLIFRKGMLPKSHENDRVLYMTLSLVPKPFPDDAFRTNIRQIAQQIIHDLQNIDADDRTVKLMQQSLDLILQIEPPNPDRPYEYIGALSKPHHAAVFYTMRPKPKYAQRLKEISDHVIPKNVNPEHSFGLPIRASDKCIAESECLSFATYMDVIHQVWTKHKTKMSNNITIVLTTESKMVLDDMKAYQSEVHPLTFDYTFVVNTKDIMPGSGLPTDYVNSSKEEVMLSMISSIQTQLIPGYTIGNCCSNFHLLLFDFLRDGCGLALHSWNQCLQENANPNFHICCQWTSTLECKSKRDKHKFLDGAQQAHLVAQP